MKLNMIAVRTLCVLAAIVMANCCLAGGPYTFYPMQPCRLVDTRSSISPVLPGEWGPPSLAARADGDPYTGDRVFTGVLASHCSVPSNAKAISVVVTALNYQALGRFTIYPADATSRPAVSTMNYRMGDGIANVGTVIPLSADGKFRVFSNQNADFILDVNGYYKP